MKHVALAVVLAMFDQPASTEGRLSHFAFIEFALADFIEEQSVSR